jgi:DNA polymerase III sliding clamp (beta) subunit (PCNA family)
MIINTKDFQEAANKILLAADLDKTAANLELIADGSILSLNVTNREFYVSVRFTLDAPTTFHAVVDAALFLSLVSGITTDTFNLDIDDTKIVVTSGKSKYKLPMIYDNEGLMKLPVISISNKTVEMNFPKDVMSSILNVNSKELLKLKSATGVVNELQKLYYIDETGCFTFTTGACVNAFTLEKPIKLLLNERIVKLFKLFKDDAAFTFGIDPIGAGQIVTKMTLETADTYLAAIITCDDLLINKVQGPCSATKRLINEAYNYRLVIAANEFHNAISRLMMFTKNNKSVTEKANAYYQPVKITLRDSSLIIQDKFDNAEYVTIENESYMPDTEYTFHVNIVDIKLVLESCKNEHVNFNCGNSRSITISRGTISNLIPEVVVNAN